MMKLCIRYVSVLVVTLLFAVGLNGQQLEKAEQNAIKAFPEWSEENPVLSNPFGVTKEQLDLTQKSMTIELKDEGLTRYDVTESVDFSAFQKKHSKRAVFDKDFTPLSVLDAGAFGSLDGNILSTKSVYFTVKVEMTALDGSIVNCSGAFIDPKTILLSGNCVFSQSNYGGVASQIVVTPAADGRITEENNLLEYGIALGSGVVVPTGWSVGQNVEFNFGLIELDRPIGGAIDLFESDNEGLFRYASATDEFLSTATLRNESYPVGEGFEADREYTRRGIFDDVSTDLLSHVSTSFAGQPGSAAYSTFEGTSTVYGILSHLRNGETNYVRLTDSKVNFIDNFIESITPTETDLVALKSPTNYIPDRANPGEPLVTGNDIFLLLAHNYSSTAYQGPLRWRVFLAEEPSATANVTFLGTIGFPEIFVNSKQTIGIRDFGSLIIPSNLTPGTYYLGVVLEDVEDDISGNNNRFSISDFEPIQIGTNYIVATPSELNVTSDAGSSEIAIESDLSWEASTTADWLTIIPNSGTGNGAFTITYTENPSIVSSRTDTVTIEAVNGATEAVKIAVTQSQRVNFLQTVQDTFRVDRKAGTFVVNVQSDLGWTISDLPDWLSVAAESGTGTSGLEVSYARNPVEAERVGEFNINSTGEDSIAITVIQSPAVNCAELVNGGTVSLTNGATEATIVVDDEADLLFFDVMGATGDEFVYVITDEQNEILAILPANSQDFNAVGVGVSRVWGLSYTGNITANKGDIASEVNLSDDCFDLSDNFVTINQIDCDGVAEGGQIRLEDGSTATTVYLDEVPDILAFFPENNFGDRITFVITDNSNRIVRTINNNSVNFNIATAGTFRIWSLAYSGNLTAPIGANAASIRLSTGCFDLSDNFITVTAISCAATVNGGEVSLSDFALEATVFEDGAPDLVSFISSNNFGVNYSYLITDANNNLLFAPNNGVVDFDEIASGTYKVWGLAYSGAFLAQIGEDITAIALSNQCFDLSENFVSITKVDCAEEVNGGEVTFMDGATEATILIDEIPDSLSFVSSNAFGDNFVFVITDTFNVIQDFTSSTVIDFNTMSSGVTRIWGLSYTGNLTAIAGENAAATNLSDFCFDLSDNFITVNRVNCEEIVDGGAISFRNGSSFANVVFDDIQDLLFFDVEGNGATSFAYLITDEQDEILAIQTNNSLDFNAVGPGTYFIRGLSYTGNLTANKGDNASVIDFSDACFDLSDNSIVVTVADCAAAVNGGKVTLEDISVEATIFAGETPDLLGFVSENATGTNFAYIITDGQDNILALSTDAFFDFKTAGAGEFKVWGVAYTGDLTAAVGENITTTDLSNFCFSLSENFIAITRIDCAQEVSGGTVELSDGSTLAYVILDEVADELTFAAADTLGENFVYLLTDEQNNILEITDATTYDFNTTATGVTRVWGLSYSGALTAAVGQNAAATTLADRCFDLSENFITVISGPCEEILNGGSISLPDGSTEIVIFIDDEADIIRYVSEGAIGGNLAYIIADARGEILSITTNNSLDFNSVGPGISRVWRLAYTGNITANKGDNINEVALSDDCFDLSDNFIEILGRDPASNIFFELRPGNSTIVTHDQGQTTFVIYTNADWNITTNVDWVQVFPVSGSGTGFIKVLYNANETGAAREAVLTVSSAAGFVQTFTIIQNGRSPIGNFGSDKQVKVAQIATDLTVAPNPANEQINLSLNVAKAVSVQIGIVDQNGKVVEYLSGQRLIEGYNTLTIAVDDLPNGLYHLTVVGEGVAVATNVLVQK